MNNFYARSVFFVNDAERSLRFYVDRLGFSEDWNYREEGRTFVCQVSLFGLELILNETHHRARGRTVFIDLDDDPSPQIASTLSGSIGADRRS
ncbi:MAG TPA: glyoxalase superfamily protein [Gemmatimonadaceae bacterium]|nr:glyoxalase superfamily protein [Gemmatimonadaceae bacterium]